MTNQRPRILAIDDTPVNLLALGAALGADFDLQVADSGAAGLEMARQLVPDLILLDVMMPDMDGYEVCRRLKADPQLRSIPVIFITAMTGIETETTGLSLGAADYITRPIHVGVARQRISNLLEREHLRQELQAQRDDLKLIAHYDSLTKLPNRVLLADRMHQALTQAQRRGRRLAVAFLDLDGFKSINDNHGHDAGDHVLITVADRMKQALRDGDTLARLGGDEFVAVLLDLDDVSSSAPMLNRLLAAASQPVQYGDLVLQVSASLGMTFYPQAQEIDAEQLLRQADHAMYEAKLDGKNRYHVFDAEQDRSVRARHENMESIQRALAERQFVLQYQPKANLRSGEVVGAEALIRWLHPNRGLLPPALFLPMIEDHPLAIDLGQWVIESVLQQLEIWQAEDFEITVSVNIGARHLLQADFVARLREILDAHPAIRPSCLELELLESIAMDDLDHVARVIEECRELGVNCALDDFGTGYSSLTYLKQLPVRQIKVDQSFVFEMLDDPDNLIILVAVLGMAKAFDLEVIAEGVETVEHGVLLLQLGCELAQGYGVARPLHAAELPAWVRAWRPDPAWLQVSTLPQADLPLLLAGLEHRVWLRTLEAFLKGEHQLVPAIDHRQCRFGKWLRSAGPLPDGQSPDLQAVEGVHRQLHALAAQLLELHATGRNSQALAGLSELHDVRDELLAQLKSLS